MGIYSNIQEEDITSASFIHLALLKGYIDTPHLSFKQTLNLKVALKIVRTVR